MVSSSRSMNPWLGASTRQGTSSERTHASVVTRELRCVWRNSATDRTSESAMGQTRIAIRASPPSLTRLVRSTAAGAGGRRELVGPSAQQDSLPARGPLDNCLRGIGLTRQAQRGAAVGFLALRRRRPAGELGAPDRRGRIHDVSSRSGTPEAHQLTDSVETVAVVVVTYNSERLIADLVASLGPGLRGLAWHLTVADNASSDNTLSQVSHHAPQARIVEMGRNAGYAAGINAAVAAAEPHTAVLVLNPDIRLTPGCVSELVAVLRRRRAGIVVPRLLGRVGRFAPFGEVITDERRYTAEVSADWAEGSIMLIDRACWQACGRWDESFFLYSEETEYALRARDNGFAVVLAPQALAHHLEGESTTSPRLWALLTVNKVRLYRRRHGLPGAMVYWAVLLLRELSRAALGNPCSRVAVRALLTTARFRETPGPLTVHATG